MKGRVHPRFPWARQALFTVLFAVMVFTPAGTIAFWQGWLFLLIFIACSIAIGLYFMKHDPALIERRSRVGPSNEQRPEQKIIMTLLLATFLLMLIVPGLDHRFTWSNVPGWLSVVADGSIAASFAGFFIVMKQNSYAAATVHVEAAQPVISTGLYGLVRHPMYALALPMMVSIPLALGSYWGLLLLVPVVPLLAWRLLDEERCLSTELPGYAEYCGRVRYRLIPGLW
jgi:protein-S-isoprenylcysteine O-methyltransferase Ste14